MASGPRLALAPDPRVARVAQARREWSAQLVELGGPNTLLWYREQPSGTLDLTGAHLGARAALLAGGPTRLSELFREPVALDDARRRAAALAAKADELEEEHGILTCFVGIGMATWTVWLPNGRAASRAPAAPVLLQRCTLRPLDVLATDWLVETSGVAELNPVLVQYMAGEGITLDSAALEALAVRGPVLDPYPVYATLAEVCAEVADLSVKPRILVDTFPYYKAPLVADLGAQGDRLARHDIVAALAGDDALPAVSSTHGPGAASRVHAPDRLDQLLVLDADAAQQEVVHRVRSGSHLVVNGPPGTGKSQTVANLVAALAADGQRVLLVAEKRAAIDSVLDRLDRVGLRDLVLDVRSGGHERRTVLRELVEGLETWAAHASEPSAAPASDEALAAASSHATVLERRVAALHERRDPWQVTLFEVQEAVAAFSASPRPPRSKVRLADAVLRALDRGRLATAERTLTTLASLSGWDGAGAANPWYGALLPTGTEADEARERITRLADGGVESVATTLQDVFSGITLPTVPTVLDWGRMLDTVTDVRDTLEVFRPEIFDIPLGDLVAATGTAAQRRATGSSLGAWERRRLRRQARGLLRPGRPPQDLHAVLSAAMSQRETWRGLAGSGGRPEIPVELDRAREAHAELVDDLVWLDERVAAADDGAGGRRLVELDLDSLQARIATLAAHADRISAAPAVRTALDGATDLGLGDLAADLRVRRVPAADVPSEVRWVWWCSLADTISAHDVRLTERDGAALTDAIAGFGEADRELRDLAAQVVRGLVARNVVRVRGRSRSQVERLRAEAVAPGRGAPLPDVVAAVADIAGAVRPCWAMSPLDVPSVIPPGEWFDVVIVEEASLVAPAVAVPALSRASRSVLVGDRHQMLPTSFIAASGSAPSTEAGSGVPSPESVLDVLSPVLPSVSLPWHYRSHDERLVAFANSHVYNGRLRTFPATATDPVIHLESVEGHGLVTDGEAAVETTTAEVERVVADVIDHARNRPERTLAVIALGPVHAARIAAALQRTLDSVEESVRDFFAATGPERFTVKDLSRFQGEERDDIVIAVGFGATPHGRVIHRFGALSTDAGHRLLTVAVTRARRSLTVVTSIASDQLDPGRLRTPGTRMLRELLHYAESGGAGIPRSDQAPSVLIGQLAARLREEGLTVHTGVGTPGSGVELAVEDPAAPGVNRLALECDGEEYAAAGSVRERDRLRAEQLEARGWRHLRVWSTDLFRDPAREESRILDALGLREAPGD